MRISPYEPPRRKPSESLLEHSIRCNKSKKLYEEMQNDRESLTNEKFAKKYFHTGFLESISFKIT